MVGEELYKLRYILIIETALLVTYAIFNIIPFLLLFAFLLIFPLIYITFNYPITGVHLLIFSILAGSIGVVKISGKAPTILFVDIFLLYILALFIIKAFLNIENKIKIPTLMLLWIPFLVWSILGLVVGIDKTRVLIYWKNYFAGFISLSFAYFVIKKEFHIKSIIIGYIIWGVILSLIEIKILIDLGGISNGIIGLYLRKNLLATSWGSSNYLSCFFVMIIPISIGYFVYTNSYKLKSFIIMAIILMSSAIILTLSRGGLLSLFIAVLFLFFRIIKKKTLIPILIIFLVIIGILLLNPLTYVLIGRFISLGKSDSVFTRINFYHDVWNTFLKYPITGVGFGNLGLYAEFVIPLAASAAAHNIVLGMLGETGVLGALFFMIILGRTFWELISGYQKENNYKIKILRWSFLASFLGVFFHSLMEPNFDGIQFSIMIWTLIGTSMKLDLLRIKNNKRLDISKV